MKVLDLFSGIGGFSIGFEKAGFETVAFCEFDENARKVLRKNWPNTPIYNDVKELNYEQLRKDGISVDIICGGFPCQDISLAGKGAGLEGERSGLWFEFHRLIEEIKPKYAVIKNVSALRSRGLDQVLRSLSEIGYDAEWHCIPASAVGAPHRRDRIWIVAYPRHRSWWNGISGIIGRNGEWEHEKIIGSAETIEITGSSSSSKIMANSNNDGWNGSKNTKSNRKGNDGNSTRKNISIEFEGSSDLGTDFRGSSCQIVADSNSKGLEGQWTLSSGIEKELKNISYSCGWAVEPNVGRVANGIPNRTHRLKQLGNAVVPQIPELLAMAIIDYERSK